MNCDGLARWYRWLEYLGLGRKLERCRFAFLPDLADARRVLVLGDGDGRFLAALLNSNPVAEVDAVDSSARMLALARKRTVAHAARVRFHHADAFDWHPPRRDYDVIVTHFFLDCFTDEQLARLAEAVVGCRDEKSAVGRIRLPSTRRRAGGMARPDMDRGVVRVFRVVTGLRVRRLPDHRAILEKQGLRCERSVLSDGGLLTAELWRRT